MPHPNRPPIVCVAAAVIRTPNDPRVLIGFNQKADRWQLPGGKVETGETLHEALARELMEETGVETTTPAPFRHKEHPEGYVVILYTAIARNPLAATTPEPKRFDRVQWANVEDLPASFPLMDRAAALAAAELVPHR